MHLAESVKNERERGEGREEVLTSMAGEPVCCYDSSRLGPVDPADDEIPGREAGVLRVDGGKGRGGGGCGSREADTEGSGDRRVLLFSRLS